MYPDVSKECSAFGFQISSVMDLESFKVMVARSFETSELLTQRCNATSQQARILSWKYVKVLVLEEEEEEEEEVVVVLVAVLLLFLE